MTMKFGPGLTNRTQTNALLSQLKNQKGNTTHKIFGNYIEPEENSEYLILNISPSSLPLEQYWRNNGLTADYLAEYWDAFFPAHNVPASQQQAVKEAIGYITNELLENMMKFSYRPTKYPYNLSLYLHQTEFRLYASNAIDPQKLESLRTRIQALLTQDPYELFVQQVEKNLTFESANSQLGYITIINNFDGRLAWKLETNPSDIVVVTTMVRWTWQN